MTRLVETACSAWPAAPQPINLSGARRYTVICSSSVDINVSGGLMPKFSDEERARRAATRRRRDALRAEEDARRVDAKHAEWDRDGTRLSWEEYVAGVTCRGCGLAMNDGLGGWPPLMKLSEDERVAHDLMESLYRQAHPDCRSHRWSMQGSRQWHCGFCCPPPPLSLKQIQRISSIFGSIPAKEPANLARWRLSLTCDHVVDATRHRSHTYWSGRVHHCEQCGEKRGVVDSQPVSDEQSDQEQREAERARLSKEIASEQAALDRRQADADRSRRKIDDLTRKLSLLESTTSPASGT
ncbi:hypothetical protein F4553_005268 [Allocatelliglobosispora scoriae]|uniref:Uncharacterized protein n=1 Tax=Allocatelliglobosispora scoriae TaxID=643052 RepID=A0A841BXM0_9ACTN|nr:hypothetical protein [Allocatelliglobosispora scoriae]